MERSRMSWQDNIPKDTPQQESGTSSGYGGTTMFPSGGSIAGGIVPWNKEMMQFLTEVPIPEYIMQDPKYEKLWLWTKRVLIHMSLTGLSVADKNRLRKDLEYILILAHQDGAEMLCAERQLMFVAELELSKSIPDPVHGVRERIAWLMSMVKNIFAEDGGQRPSESKSGLNLPFLGGGRNG